ncbi:MAG: sterol desaturase family protein [Candidatus Eremiobacteraeota bacterium]|nr:sterol desaturase family protein [Candidatus Eremiobacteraeota bacterium]
MEFFRHGSNALIAGLLLGGAGIFLSGQVALRAPAVALGLVIFFVSEYTTHRFFFHARPFAAGMVRRFQHRMHYDHHREPNRLDLLFLPPWFVAPVFALYGLAYYIITRDTAIAVSLLFGNLLGLLYYEWVHYVAHIPFVPLTPYGRWIKKYHLLHHFKNERYWFGVTNPSMDVMGATLKERAAVGRSATVKDLFG